VHSLPRSELRARVVLVAASLLLGVLFRNVWAEDMEWKADERTMFEASQRSLGESWPWVGMPSGVGISNPGMSVWTFAVLAHVFRAREPLALVRLVMVMNSVALAAVFAFALTRPEQRERWAWTWAGALASVNPGLVQLHRKIWAQSILPVFSVATLAAWWHRRTRWGAFLWGSLGACLGQIHLSGTAFALGLVGWTALFEKKHREEGTTRWGWWALGSAAAGWPLLPWLALVVGGVGRSSRGFSIWEPLRLQFWGEWLVHVAGLQTAHSLGRTDFLAWIREPVVRGRASHLVAFAVVVCALLVLAIVAGAARVLWRERGAWRTWVIGRSPTACVQNAAFLAFGIVLTVLAVRIRPHYLLVAFPLPFVWLARAALLRPSGARLLGLVWLGHAVLAAAFLHHVHVQPSLPGSDYGTPFIRVRAGP
jgi:hypothetical protein